MATAAVAAKRAGSSTGGGAGAPKSEAKVEAKAAAKVEAKKRKVFKQGLLTKQGGSLGGWQTWNERWFVFHSDGVSYYKNESAYIKGERELGFLQLDKNLAFKNQDEAAELFFRIVSSGRTIIVKAKTMDVKKKWLEIMANIKDETSSLDVLLTEISKGGTIEEKAPKREAALAPPDEKKKEVKAAADVKMISNSLKEGWLRKVGNKVQNWRRRYFVLLANTLDYYKDDKAKKKMGTIPFSRETTCTVVGLPHTFCVTPTPGARRYIIEAANDEERDQWMTAIHSLPEVKVTVVFPDRKMSESTSRGEDGERALDDILSARGPEAKEKLDDFLNFAKSIFSEENVLFWLDVHTFKATEDAAEQLRLAEAINIKYFSAGSEFEVAAAPERKDKLSKDIDEKKLEKTMFEPEQKACFMQILADIFPKFSSRSLGEVADSSRAAIEREEQEKKVDCVPVDQLVALLSNVKSVENLFFRRAFLLYYRAFLPVDDLFTRLEAAYQADGDPKLALAAKLHVVSIFQEWVKSTRFLDISVIYPRAQRVLRRFREEAQKAMGDDSKSAEQGPLILASELQALICMIEEAKDEDDTKMRLEGKVIEEAEEKASIEAREDICDYSPQVVAECITQGDYAMFSKLQWREFYDKAWQRKEIAATASPNILKMIDNFNHIGNWVASEILNREDAKVRLKCISHFINIALELKKMHNFYGLFGIWAGLNMMPVCRLKKAWAALPTSQKDSFEYLKKSVADPAFNWKAYRRLFKLGLGRPQIPHMAVILKDCFQLEEIATIDRATGNVNFGKFMKQYRELVDVFQCQKVDYHLSGDARALRALQSCMKHFMLSNDKMWTRSYRFEPKAES